MEWITLTEARANRLKIDWESEPPWPTPAMTGVHVFEDYPLQRFTGYIDWSPFFRAWGLKGRYPDILEHETYKMQANKLFHDGRELLDEIVENKWLAARAVIGLFHANSQNDDILVYDEQRDREPLAMLLTLRQQNQKRPGQPNLALADFIAPAGSGRKDHIGVFVLTTGIGLDELENAYKQKRDDFKMILVKTLADRLVEAFAEHMHYRVRTEFWGYSMEENTSPQALHEERYQGIRPAPGYPACPDHSEKEKLFELTDAQSNTSIRLNDHFVMHPSASICGYYFAHPQARYFRVGKIQKDQIIDYARRKNRDVPAVERFLSTQLAYK